MENLKLQEQEAIAQTERIGLGDLIIVGIIAALTWLAATIWEFPGLYPGVWNDAVVASYVRPATNVVPGYWTAIASVIYSIFGIHASAAMMRLAGHLFLAGVAVCVYAVLREWLAFAMRMRPQFSKRRTLVMRMAAALGAAAFIAAEPVWTAGQCLSETTILLGLSLAAIEFFFVFLRKGTIKYAYFCALVVGLLAAESPMGLLFPVIFIGANYFILKYVPAMESPLFRPSVMEVGKWYITFIFLFAFIAGVALNCWTFIEHNGVEAIGGTTGDIPLRYLLEYWHRVTSAGSSGGWVLWLGVCILPFVVATIKFPESADEEQFLPYASGLIFFFCGLLVFAQFASISSLWFWSYFPMNSQYMLTLGLFCCAATLALSITILGVDSLCRDHARLSNQAFGEGDKSDDDDDDDDDYADATSLKKRRAAGRGAAEITASMNFFRRLCVIAIPLLMIATMIPGRVQSTTREMMTIIRDAVTAIVDEAEDAEFLFTDGNLDTIIELEAAYAGKPLKCYSLMGGSGAMATHLRMRGITDDEDKFSFRYDTAMGLRTWIRDKPERLKKSAALMGFDLWKRDGKPLPPMGGFLSRPAGFRSEEARQAAIKVARAIEDRILAVHSHGGGGVKSCRDEIVKRAFFTLQWRLARMCLYRSEADDVAGRADEAIFEATRSKTLNDCNEIYKGMVAAMERRSATMLQKLTPREGLQLALVRADFTMGKMYAETVLSAEPDNPDANFAMGMYYLTERQLSRAERYLLRCLIRKPNEPAVYNNLAMIQIELKRFDAARVNIEKALKLIPDSSAVLDTKKALEKAIEEAKNPAKKKPIQSE